MSWLLDTDVICQPAKRRGDSRVVAWLQQGKGPLLHQCGRHRSTRRLGSNERRTATAGTAGLVDAPRRCDARAYPRIQRVGGACMGGTGAHAREGWPADARRRQLHRGNSQTARPHDRHRQRPGLPSPWPHSFQSVQGTAERLTQRRIRFVPAVTSLFRLTMSATRVPTPSGLDSFHGWWYSARGSWNWCLRLGCLAVRKLE